jgi:hypothetical protein
VCIDSLDTFILNRIKSIYSKLQDNKQHLVSNLEYILEKVKETSSNGNYEISRQQANELEHNDDFKKRLTDLQTNIRVVKLLTISMKAYKYYFLIPSMNTPHKSVYYFRKYFAKENPIEFNNYVKRGLSNFKELYNDFNTPTIAKLNKDSSIDTLLVSEHFLKEYCYKRFMDNFSD